MSDREPTVEPTPKATRLSVAMFCLRYVLPAVVVIGGVVVMALGSESDVEGGAGIAGAGLAIFAMNWLIHENSGSRIGTPYRSQKPRRIGQRTCARTESDPCEFEEFQPPDRPTPRQRDWQEREPAPALGTS